MPPKQRVTVQPSSGGRRLNSRPQGYLASAWRELTAPENQSVVISVTMFGVSKASES